MLSEQQHTWQREEMNWRKKEVSLFTMRRIESKPVVQVAVSLLNFGCQQLLMVTGASLTVTEASGHPSSMARSLTGCHGYRRSGRRKSGPGKRKKDNGLTRNIHGKRKTSGSSGKRKKQRKLGNKSVPS